MRGCIDPRGSCLGCPSVFSCKAPSQTEYGIPAIDWAPPRVALGDTVIFVASDREGREARAAIVTEVRADGRRDLLVAGRAGFYPEWGVPYSARNDARTWHEKE